LIPLFTAYACSIFLHQPFDRRQLKAGLISFFGVILIARPDQLWLDPSAVKNGVTPAQHLYAVGIALISDIGATVAFTTIRVIGPRAHALISVNYYGMVSTLVSGLILLLPSNFSLGNTGFSLIHSAHEWILLLGLGIFGFLLQFLMTAGLLRDSSPRATNMMYSSVVFSLGMDWAIWGLVPGWTSWVGGGVVVGATVWAAMSKKVEVGKASGDVEEYRVVAGEEDET
jgi:drug/metabolite transporter (DMT)-like permease